MKNKIFTFLFLLITATVFSQTYTMPAGTGTATISTCSGTFVDNGGSASNYSSNQNSTITFCPATPGDVIKISFSSYNTEPSGATACFDYLEMWNANAVGAAGTQDARYCGNLGAFTIVSTSPDGCISFRFVSDNNTQRAGWVATVSCATPCVTPVAALTNTSTLNLCPPTSLNPGSLTVAFDASPSTSSQGTVSSYVWTWGDGTTTTTATPTTTHTYPGTGVYTAQLVVRNNNTDVDPSGCPSTNGVSRVIKILPEPNFTGTTASPINLSCGGSTTLTGVAASQTITSSPIPVSTVTALPDGTGASYTSGINYTGFFPAGSTVTPACYPKVILNLEHSYANDLTIDLLAPTGQTVRLFNRHGIQGTPPFVTAIYEFGSCVNAADNGVPGCGATYTVVGDGTGQSWTNYGAVIGTTTTSPCAGYAGACEAGTYYRPITYNSTNSFAGFNGADLNGTWSLRVTDNAAQDDGTLFSWSLDFPTTCYSGLETVTPDMTTAVWSTTGTGPAIPSQTTSSAVVTDPGPGACPTPGTCLGNRLTNSINLGPFLTGGSFVYDFTATDEFGCQYQRSVTINVPNGPAFTVPSNITQCAGTTVAGASFTSVPAGATFSWTNSNTAIGLAASGNGNVPSFVATNASSSAISGTVTVTATSGSCSTVHTYTVTVNPLPTGTISGTQKICPGSTAIVSVALTGTAPWSITYTTNGGSPVTVNNILTSPYTFTTGVGGTYAVSNVTDAVCSNTGTGSAIITINPAIVVSNIVTTCTGVNYVVTFDISGGTTPYTVTGGTGTLSGNTFTSSSIPSGTSYSFNVNDALNCASLNVDVDGVKNCACGVTGVVSGGGSACSGSPAPNVVFTLANGTVSPYTLTYAINGVTQPAVTVSTGFPSSTYSITNPSAGTYTIVSIADASCTGSGSGAASVTILTLPTATVTGGGNACAGNAVNVSVALTGTGPWNLTYAIGGINQPAVTGINSSPYIIAATTSGTYTVVAVNDVNCTGTSSGSASVTINPIPAVTNNPLSKAICSGDNTSINLTSSVASSTFNYTASVTSGTVTGLTPSATGITSIGDVLSNTTVNSGSVTYVITPVGPAPTFCQGTPVNYVVTVNPKPIIVNQTSVICSGTAFNIAPTGVPAGTVFTWNTPVSSPVGAITGGSAQATGQAAISQTLTNGSTVAATATYTVTPVAGSCTGNTFTIVVTVDPIPAFTVTSTNPTTCGGSQGTITLSGLNPATAYDITYTNASGVVGPVSMTSTGTGTIVISSLTQGTYSNITTSLTGCNYTDVATYTLNDPAPPVFTVTAANPTTCGGTGTLTLSGLNTSTAYDVTYTDASGVAGPTSMNSDGSGNIIINVLAGSYSVITVNLNGCTTTDPGTFVLSDPGSPTFTVTASNPTTCGGANGSITLSGLTANTSYDITYTNGPTFGPNAMVSDASGNIIINGLSAGNYIDMIVSLLGCSSTNAGPFVLTSPAAPSFSVTSSDPTTCGGTDGSLTLSGLVANTSYDVTYSNGTTVGPVSMTSDGSGNITISGLSQGSYNNVIVATGSCNTTVTGPFTLSDPSVPTYTVTSSNPTTCSGTDGSITLSGLIATTSYSVTYTNGSTVTGPVNMTSDATGNIVISGLSQGIYSNLIVNLVGCNGTDAGPYILTDPSAPVFTITPSNPTTCGGLDGTLTLSGLSASTSYNLGYLDGVTVVGPTLMTTDASGNIVITGLSSGTYSNIVVSLAGCTSTNAGPFVLTTPSTPAAPTASGAAYCQGAVISSVTASGTGGTFNWYDDAALTLLLSSNATYTPTNTVTDTFYVTETVGGCTSPATPVIISINSLPTADAGPPQPIGCGIIAAILDGSASSTGINITYNWTTINGNIVAGTNSITPTVDAAGSYTVTVTNTTTGCSSVDSVLVVAAPAPAASFSANPMSGTSPLPVDFTNSSSLSNTYVWNFGDGSALVAATNPSYIYTTPGTYNVTLIASNNNACPDTATATIVVYDDFTIVIPNVFTPNGDNNNDIFKVYSTGVENLKGEIFDRWGLKLYDWNQINEGWDGRTPSGVVVVDGTYYYIITVKAQDGKEHLYKGFIQLLSK
ncbi:MAG: Protein of unknown function precursor [Bacteroidetes bacterium]|jgi:gliding motility-associated-like protein|nr:Protein of unknown function precursor [Bacteroidota bacterium]